jgi:hypothetical protein
MCRPFFEARGVVRRGRTVAQRWGEIEGHFVCREWRDGRRRVLVMKRAREVGEHAADLSFVVVTSGS